ncbi:MAG TPA: phage major capsid protein [Desulfobacteraceae bacterium]|nr:phage major capsid protein [Desulfobacteraceae bacterium]HPQ28619.1 phage major capsid protein [Desulfobacteraceae bacterium]
MSNFEKIKNDIQKLTNEKFRLVAFAKKEGRENTPKEELMISELDGAIEGLKAELEKPEKPLTLPSTIGTSSKNILRGGPAFALRGPQDKKDYRSLFGSVPDVRWTDKDSTFFQAVFSGRFHPGLIKNSMTETVPSDGGFLVPGELAAQIHAVSLEDEIVMPRCFVQPMRSNEIDIPAMTIGDHSANLYGGFTASYTAEAGTISEANPKIRDMKLQAKKLTGLLRFSSELSQDIPGGENQLVQICGKGLAWYRDKAFLKGTGAGEPLGILNAGCTIEVEKENGQVADTIQYENLTAMVGRLHPACFNHSVWVCQVSAIPQLLQLSMAVGTGGSAIPVLTADAGGTWRILTRPVIFTEKTEKLGDRGDIILADFSQYVVGLRSGMRFDMSPHVHFETDEMLARLIERHDGEPLWDEPLTLEDGSTTVSPFVVLEERA